MSVFEHLMTLGSFILALGLATILMFVATLVHRRAEVRLSLPHALWTAAIFVNQINFWLGSYVYHEIEHASLEKIGFVIAFPILLYLQSAMVVAEQSGALDMPAHHARNKRYYVGLVVLASALDAIYFMRVVYLTDYDPTFFFIADAVLIGSGLLAMFVNARWIQVLAPALQLGLRLFGFFLASAPLLAP
jgi:hypothetical protein